MGCSHYYATRCLQQAESLDCIDRLIALSYPLQSPSQK
jgi:hypothetical protein